MNCFLVSLQITVHVLKQGLNLNGNMTPSMYKQRGHFDKQSSDISAMVIRESVRLLQCTDGLPREHMFGVLMIQSKGDLPHHTNAYLHSFFPQTMRDWNELPDSLISSAELSDDFVSKNTSLVRAQD